MKSRMNRGMDGLKIANRVLNTEIQALELVRASLGQTFNQILEAVNECRGKVVITGMGKSGHVGRKIAASMASLGIPAFFVHPGEAMHGDLGMVQPSDLVIAISYSGESDEIKCILPGLQQMGVKLVGITSNPESTLARKSYIAQIFPETKEACHLGLAPTSSTTAVMAYGDALAVAASELKKFGKKDFAVCHPAGSLGKKLTIRAIDLMKKTGLQDVLRLDSKIKDAILALGRMGGEIIAVEDERKRLLGIITNGSLERELSARPDIYRDSIEGMVKRFPVFVDDESMAIDALQVMKDSGVKAVPVVKEEKVIGILQQKDIIQTGIYL